MKWFIGIDGGGTKTAFVISKRDGTPVHIHIGSGCSYQEIGQEKVISVLIEGITTLLKKADATKEDCAGCCIGLPCFGENVIVDEQIQLQIKNLLAPIPVVIVNDSIVGWAGSLECQEGIHIVAGTGSIAVGCGTGGAFARCGGWTEFFSDEGSCYWIGRKAMELFSTEADGRVPKGVLYHIVREVYELDNDFEFVEKILNTIAPYRDKVAEFQRIALKAAIAGDPAAQDLYRQAAEELSQLVSGVKSKLIWSREPITVSYYGGLFHAGEYILNPLEDALSSMGCILQKPLRSATEGALLLAIKKFSHKEKEICF